MRPAWRTVLLGSAIALLNLWIVHELLTIEFTDHMFSIEGSFIGLARYIGENWGDLTWFPLWYGGVPFQNLYPPLLHVTVAGIAKVFGIAPGLAYHATTAVFYSLGPVTLFLFALELSRSRAYSFAAGLAYSLLSPSTFLIPVVRWDAGGAWHPRRLQALVQYGEGPHITVMTLLPLALLLVAIASRKRTLTWWIPAALGMSAVALTNWIGTFVLAIAIPAWLLATWSRSGSRRWPALAAATAYAYALCCSWLPPSSILNVRRTEMYLVAPVSASWVRLAWAVGVIVSMLALALLFRRHKTPEALRFSILFLIPMAALTLSTDWFGVLLFPQARRCHLEMEMGIVLTTVFAAKLLLDRMPARARVGFACVLVVVLVVPAIKYRRYARRLDRSIDIRSTIEYREAQQFARLGSTRVLAPGSVGFFLNAFTDVPQLSGGVDQSLVNFQIAGFRYQIFTGENAGAREGEVAALGLQAFGVGAVGVSGPRSREVFKPFRNPWKFAGLLPEAWRDGDDVIYRVPQRSASLAHVIRAGDLPPRAPLHGLDVDPIRGYLRALEDPSLPPAALRWRNRHQAVITAPLARGQILSVQMSYHPGWSATVEGEPRRVMRDHLGQIEIEPGCEGPCTVELTYDGGTEMRVARAISWTAVIAGLMWLAWGGAKSFRSAVTRPR